MLRLLLGLGFIAFAQSKTDFTEEENVIVLTTSNFDAVINEIDYTLVEFYAPWCGHCKALKPEYEKAAGMLKTEFPEGNVRLAKVDATVESELASKHGVTGYPTLKLYKNKKWFDFNGDRKAASIVDWMKRKTLPPLKTLSTESELDAFIKSAPIVIVGFIKDGHAARPILEDVADSMDKFPFGVVTSAELFGKQNIPQDAEIVMFKSFDGDRAVHTGEMTSSAITDFINSESIPLVVEFTPETAGDVFGSPIRIHLIAFVPKSGDYEKNKAIMTTVAKKFKGKVHFILIDTEWEDHERIMDFFGLKSKDAPTYRIINLADDMVKYKPDSSEFSDNAMSAFAEEVVSGKRKPFLISEEILPASDEPVHVIVGKQYNEVTQDTSKAVFVELYAPWCNHCKQLAPIWTELGTHFKDDADIIIAKMDATVNEAEGLKINSFPTLKYYPKGSKEAIDYNGERTLEALKKFVESDGKVAATEKQTEEEQKDEL